MSPCVGPRSPHQWTSWENSWAGRCCTSSRSSCVLTGVCGRWCSGAFSSWRTEVSSLWRNSRRVTRCRSPSWGEPLTKVGQVKDDPEGLIVLNLYARGHRTQVKCSTCHPQARWIWPTAKFCTKTSPKVSMVCCSTASSTWSTWSHHMTLFPSASLNGWRSSDRYRLWDTKKSFHLSKNVDQPGALNAFLQFTLLSPAEQKMSAAIGVPESFVVRQAAGQTVKKVEYTVVRMCCRGNFKMTTVLKLLVVGFQGIDMDVVKRMYLALVLFTVLKETNLWSVAERFQLSRGFIQTLLSSSSAFCSCVLHFTEVRSSSLRAEEA